MRKTTPTTTLDRRGLLSSAVCLAFASKPFAAVADADAIAKYTDAVRARGDAGLSAWNQPFSKTCSWNADPGQLASEAPLPSWLGGRWRVQSKLDGVSFPMGRQLISNSMPGVRMVSILPLPNIGAAPIFEVEYGATTGSTRAANTAATLEAFWPSAKVVDVSTPRLGQTLLRYQSPTRTRDVVQQSVNLQLCASQGGATSGVEDEWTVAEVFQQDNVEQGTRGEYLSILVFKKLDGDSNKVRARQRIAAFLQPTDGAFFDAVGRPVALYDYTFDYTRL